jgi:hypothetical protein
MDLTIEEYQKAKKAGYSTDRIAQLLTLDAPKKAVTTQAPKVDNLKQAEMDVAARGDVWDKIIGDYMSPNPVRKVMGNLEFAAVPTTAIENAISNPVMAMQRGNFNPMDLAKEAGKGLIGQKQGQYGDIMRGVGVPKPIAAGVGLAYNALPIGIAGKISKAFTGVTKASDKGILRAGEELMKAGDQATEVVGGKLNEAYKVVNDIPIDPNAFLKTAKKLPKVLIDKLEEVFGGKIDSIAQNLNVGILRDIKSLVGKYRPAAFNELKTASETIEGEAINSVYGSIKNLMHETMSKTLGNKKASQAILEADENFGNVAKATKYVKTNVLDPILQKATNAGKMAGKIAKEGDVSGRDALNTFRKYARKSTDKAVSALESFNRWRAISEGGRKVVNAMAYGGVAGSLGGLALGKVVRPNSD